MSRYLKAKLRPLEQPLKCVEISVHTIIDPLPEQIVTKARLTSLMSITFVVLSAKYYPQVVF